MKLKLGDVLNLNHTLKLIIDDKSKKIDPILKFKLLGLMKSLGTHVENFEIIKNEKIKEYGKETDDGNIVISDEDTESLKKFQNDLNPVINSDITLKIEKIKAEEIFDKGIPAEYLISLYPFIEE